MQLHGTTLLLATTILTLQRALAGTPHAVLADNLSRLLVDSLVLAGNHPDMVLHALAQLDEQLHDTAKAFAEAQEKGPDT